MRRFLRRWIPLWAYSLLAPIFRWKKARQVSRMAADDAKYLKTHPGVRVPEAELRYDVGAPVSIPEFLASGRAMAMDIEQAIKSVGASMAEITDAFDFGCGSGRLLIAAASRWPHIRWSACDVDRRAVAWCAENLTGVATFANSPLPPLPLSDASADLIWCGSVFTHLDELMQDAWLQELGRILRPTGWLLASVLGPGIWEGLPPWTVRIIRAKGFLFSRTEPSGLVRPGWYQTAWHTEHYVHQHWGRYFFVCRYLPRGLHSYQDLVVLRRPAEQSVEKN